MADFFISYCKDDAEVAAGIATALEKAGYSTWYYGEHSKIGADYLAEIGHELDQCSTVVFIISEQTLESQEVYVELVQAHRLPRRMVPLLRGIKHRDMSERARGWIMAFGYAVALELPSDGWDYDGLAARIAEGLEKPGTPSSTGGAQRQDPCAEVPIDMPVCQVFQDRDDELAELRKLLGDPKARFICVVGRGGIGKTALVCQACVEMCAQQSVAGGPGKIIYIDGATVDTPILDRIVERIAASLGDREGPAVQEGWRDATRGLPERVRFLLTKLQNERQMLILDSAERLLDQDNTLADLDLRQFVDLCLRGSHRLQIVAISRERVELGMEALEARRLLKLGQLPAAYGAAVLRELDPQGELGLRDAPQEALEECAHKCNGVPYALRRVASLLYGAEDLSLPELLQNEKLFGEGVVENLLAENYQGLTPAGRRALEVAAVFGEAAPAEGLRFVLGALCPEIDVDEALPRLVRGYFLEHPRGSDSYRMHPMDREYAYAQIPDGGDGYSKRACHACAAQYYRTCRKPEAEWRTLEDLEPQFQEYDHHLRAGDYDGAAEVMDAIDYDYLQVWGYLARLVELRERLLGHIQSPHFIATNAGFLGMVLKDTGRLQAGGELLGQAYEISSQLGDQWEVGVWLNNLGLAWASLRNTRRAIEHLEGALEIAREIKDRKLEGKALGNLGLRYMDLNDYEQALEYFAKALSIALEIGDLCRQGIWLNAQGLVHSRQGDRAKAEECFAQAARRSRECSARDDESRFLRNLASILHELHRPAEAVPHLLRGVELAQEIGASREELGHARMLAQVYQELGDAEGAAEWAERSRSLESEVVLSLIQDAKDLNRLGHECSRQGRLAEAVRYFDRGLVIATEAGDRDTECYLLGNLGLANFALGNVPRALEFHEQALELSRSLGFRKGEGQDLASLGVAYAAIGQTDKARRLLEEALAIARDVRDRSWEPVHLANLGLVYLDLDARDRARDYCEEAVALARQRSDKITEALCLRSLGRLLAALGDLDAGAERCEEALGLARKAEGPLEVSHALTWLGYARMHLGDLHEARARLTEALNLGMPPTGFLAATYLGLVCLADGEATEAADYLARSIATCREALDLTPDLSDRLYALALAQLAAGQTEEALDTYRRAVSACPVKGCMSMALTDLRWLGTLPQPPTSLPAALTLLSP